MVHNGSKAHDAYVNIVKCITNLHDKPFNTKSTNYIHVVYSHNNGEKYYYIDYTSGQLILKTNNHNIVHSAANIIAMTLVLCEELNLW